MKPDALLHLNGNQNITSLYADAVSNCLFIGTNNGRIIKATGSVLNSYGTGRRVFDASVENEYGLVSSVSLAKVLYLCRDAVLKIQETGEIDNAWKIRSPYSANEEGEIEGPFITKPLWAGDDFIFWENIFWDSVLNSGTTATVQVRTADSSEGLVSSEWVSFVVSSGEQSISLDDIKTNGKWIQVKILLKTTSSFSPIFGNLTVTYRTKYALYFYTTKFSMEKGTNLDSGLIIAKMTSPTNTEVKIGIADSNTSKWNDYQIIEPDRAFTMSGNGSDRMKVGIKMISHSDDAFASVDEFALLVGGNKLKRLGGST